MQSPVVTPLGEWSVVFFALWSPVPTFHAYNHEWRDPEGATSSTDRTRCGRVVSEYDCETKRLQTPGDTIPARHAVKFGKPCRKCFPTATAPKRSLPDPAPAGLVGEPE